MITLPKEKSQPKVNNPKFLILFGRPKAGNKEYCRLYEESYKSQLSKIGEGCDANTEQTINIAKGFIAA
jgi:hypothetical protein